jgi:hypothetical protein
MRPIALTDEQLGHVMRAAEVLHSVDRGPVPRAHGRAAARASNFVVAKNSFS